MEGFMDSRDHPIKKFVTGQKGKDTIPGTAKEMHRW